MALAAVPAVGADVGEEKEYQRAKEHDADRHRRVVEVGRRHRIHSRQHEDHLQRMSLCLSALAAPWKCGPFRTPHSEEL